MKNILITGSTDGIGKLTAIKLAKEGHSVYIHGRSADKLATVTAEIKSESKNEKVAGFVADFSNLDAVKQMAHQVNEQLPHLDVLINNAGVFKSSVTHNQDGLDMRYVVNYLAPYVLTEALMPLLQKSSDPRIVNLSSAAQDSIAHEVLRGKENMTERATYGQSKLALTMWSFDLARKVPSVNTVAVNPGSLLNTNMVKEAFGQFWSSADKGANILYDLAVSEKYKDASGQYFDNDRGSFGRAHPDAYDEGEIEKLMKTTAELLGA